jgi:spermidine synthase
MSIQVEEVLDHHRSKYQDVLVFKSKTYGNVLVLDGVIQATERDEFSYQEMIAHIPLFSHPHPQRVLCIGGGDGGVLREIAKHPDVTEMILCEIDQDVIDASKQYLPNMSIGFNDPRVQVVVQDGAIYLKDHPNYFDVIITDSSDPVGPGVVLFETPFYQAMYHSLREGGIVCTQGENVWLHLDLIQPLVQQISKLYTTVELAYASVPSYPSGQLGYIIATKHTKQTSCQIPLRTPTLAQQQVMKYYSYNMHIASFVLPMFAQRAIYGDPVDEKNINSPLAVVITTTKMEEEEEEDTTKKRKVDKEQEQA